MYALLAPQNPFFTKGNNRFYAYYVMLHVRAKNQRDKKIFCVTETETIEMVYSDYTKRRIKLSDGTSAYYFINTDDSQC